MKIRTLLIAAILAIPALVWGSAAGAAPETAAVSGQSEVAAEAAATPSAEAEMPTVGNIAVKDLVGKKLGVPQGAGPAGAA